MPATRAGRSGDALPASAVADDDTWADVFSRVLVEKIEPQHRQRPRDHPVRVSRRPSPRWRGPSRPTRASPSASSSTPAAWSWPTPSASSPIPIEQRRRLEAEMAEKQRIYGERYPIDEDFLAALAHMPPASGAALGFDRLVMLATGASPHRAGALDAGGLIVLRHEFHRPLRPARWCRTAWASWQCSCDAGDETASHAGDGVGERVAQAAAAAPRGL